MSDNSKVLLGSGISGAKMILIGEHAVVYKNPAIAMPFNGLKTKVSIYKSTGPITINSMYHNGLLNEGRHVISGIEALIYYVLEKLDKPKENIHINIESNIISQRGLGSSAAASIAVIRALYDSYDMELKDGELIELATFAEKIHHTNPSGLDVATLVYQTPLWFERGIGYKPIDINFEGVMMIVDSGRSSQTKQAVEHVGMLYNTKNKIIQKNFDVLKELTEETLNVLANNDILRLGGIMNEAHSALRNIEVSSKELDFLVDKTIKYGALGAKLTGGGVGGCIIALAKTVEDAKSIKNKLIKDGIENVWIAPLKDLN